MYFLVQFTVFVSPGRFHASQQRQCPLVGAAVERGLVAPTDSPGDALMAPRSLLQIVLKELDRQLAHISTWGSCRVCTALLRFVLDAIALLIGAFCATVLLALDLSQSLNSWLGRFARW